MLYIVEILLKDSVLSDTMAQMRTWLDRMGYVPVVFRLAHAQRGAVFRVEFAAAAQADAFALAFDGRLLSALGTEALSNGIIEAEMLATGTKKEARKAGAEGMTTTYRMYFFIDHRIHGQEDFQADDDVAAIRIARVLYDACSDVCEAFELWQGTREIRDAKQAYHATAQLADLIEAHQRVTIDSEEAIKDSKWMIARSRRLIETLDGIKSKARA